MKSPPHTQGSHLLKRLLRITPLRNFLFLLVFSQLCSCVPPIVAPPPTQDSNIIIAGNFMDCKTTVNGQTYIGYTVVATSYYFAGSDKIEINHNSITIPPNTSRNNIQLTLPTPTDKSKWDLSIKIVGNNCTLCANGAYGSSTPIDNCAKIAVLNNNVLIGYTAALPRWSGGKTFYADPFQPVIQISGVQQILNTDNSCGCTVPLN